MPLRGKGKGKQQRAKAKGACQLTLISDFFLKSFLRSSSQSLLLTSHWPHYMPISSGLKVVSWPGGGKNRFLGRCLAASAALIIGVFFVCVKDEASRSLSFKITSFKEIGALKIDFFVKNFDDWCSKTVRATLVIFDLYA